MSNTTDKPTFHQTIDFETLMREARKHITTLAGNLWSDHNSSDPGITQLEVLAFCIADLSYRTSFGVDDILAGYKGGKSLDIDLPLADAALPNNPVSIKDLRKVLLDMPHPQYTVSLLAAKDDPDLPLFATKLLLRNAFPTIAEGTEIPFYAVAEDGKDSFLNFKDAYLFQQVNIAATTLTEHTQEHQSSELGFEQSLRTAAVTQTAAQGSALPGKTVAGNTNPIHSQPDTNYENTVKYNNIDAITLNGLYSIQLEFEDDLTLIDTNGDGEVDDKLPIYLKDLNQNYFEETITVGTKTHIISVLLPYWDDIQWSLRKVDLNDTGTTLTYKDRDDEDYFIAVDKLNYDDYFYEYYAELLLDNHLLTAFIKIKSTIKSTIEISGVTYEFTANFLDWNELSNGVKRNYNLTDKPGIIDDSYHPNHAYDFNDTNHLIIENVSIGEENIFDIQAPLSFIKTNGKRKNIKLLIRITFDANEDLPDYFSVARELKAEFKALFDEQVALESAIYDRMKTISTTGDGIHHHYLQKINKVFDHLYGEANNIWSYLGQYRNLGEDFSKFTASRVQEIALFGKLLVAPNQNINQILAEIYFQIDQFLDPLIQFKTLSEMAEKGGTFESLFNGPLLKNGFIEDEDLENLKRKSVVYTSDLIRIIMDVAGVEAVEDFSISSYIDNRLMGRNVINCLTLTNSDIYKPRFSFDKSALCIQVNGRQEPLNLEIVKDWYNKKLNDLKAIQIPSSNYYDISMTLGTDMEIESYQSIQHDFPEIYGIGEFGLPLDATAERKANAKQLKAYLLPFEQLLANYLKQVAHLPELFSYNRTINNTYAFQTLYEVPDVQLLFKDFVEDTVTWEDFKQNPPTNGYQKILETNATTDFSSRRNRFLSHLLGRFGETFETYATQLFNQHKELLNDFSQIGTYQNKREEELTRLIDDKISFAEDYNQVSGGRYNAFDTTLEKLMPLTHWEDDNIGAYKLRLCRLLGIKTTGNSFIFGTGNNGGDKEGMHIVEHILLRPRTENSSFLPLTNRSGNEGIFIYDADKDPYSFKITIVLPRYADRFNQEAFRNFTEELIQLETPAHIVIDFKWMSSSCGQQFEQHYSAWKKGIYQLKPYYFQNRITLTDEQQEELRTAHYTKENRRLPALGLSILELQNNLTNALGSSCNLSLSLYDANNKGMILQNGVISFEHNTTDVHHIKVNEIGGTLTTYRLENGTWVMKHEFNPIIATYFDVDEFLKLDIKGLTSNTGGVGNYKVVYTLNNNSATQLIEVTKEIVPVQIKIGWLIGDEGQMLGFNTEEDGVYNRTNRNLNGYFLQFYPEKGNISITKEDGSLNQPIVLPEGIDTLSFTSILTQYGFGSYRIDYELDGETTFALVEIVPVLEITITAGEQVLTAGTNDVTNILWGTHYVKTSFDYPGGDLIAYDISNPSDPNSENGSFYQEGNISNLNLDMDEQSIWQPNHTYNLVYSYGGISINRIIYLEQEIIPVNPTIGLWRNDERVDEGSAIREVAKGEYDLVVDPLGGELIIYDDQGGELLKIEIVSGRVNLSNLPAMKVIETNLEAVYILNREEVSISFTIIKEEVKINPTIGLWRGDERVDEGSAIREVAKGEYDLVVDPLGGELIIYDDKGGELLKIEIVSGRVNLSDLPAMKAIETNLEAVYILNGEEVSISFTIIKEETEFPTIELIKGERVFQEKDFTFTKADFEVTYRIRLHPENSEVSLFKKENKQLVETFIVPSDQFITDFNLDYIYQEYGQGAFLLENTNDAGTATLTFSITVENDQKEMELTLLQNGKEIVEPTIDINTDSYSYSVKSTPVGGIRELLKQWGDNNQLIDSKRIDAGNQEEILDLQNLFNQYGKGTYLIRYNISNEQREVTFHLASKIVDPPSNLGLTILDNKTKVVIQPIEGIYNLVFDYTQEGHSYDFSFSNYPGRLILLDREKFELKKEIESPLSFSAKELASDDYTGSYYSGNNELSFKLNIINLDPRFTFQKIVKMENDIITVNLIPTLSIGHIYIWRQNEVFVSRKKFPSLALDFSTTESIEIRLTMHLEGYEATYNRTITKDELLKIAANE